MFDETSEGIMGDAIVSPPEQPERRRRSFFGRSPRRKDAPTSFTHCEDCGTKLHGGYCSHCGQVAVDYRRSFRHVIADVAESFLNWDSKFTKTLGLLMIRPGWLTNQFTVGRRTRYLHPLRVYLLVSVVFFLCARFLPISPVARSSADFTPQTRAEVEESINKIPVLPKDMRDEVSKALREEEKKSAARKEAAMKKNISPVIQIDEGGKDTEGRFGKWLEKRVKDKVGEDGTKTQLFAETLRDNISTMMLFCIPLFAFVLKILYLRQGRFYIEHLVYALHIHSFFYIAVLLTVFSAVAAKHWAPALEGAVLWVFILAIVAQVFVSIRQVYRQSWLMSSFKFFFGGFVYLFVIALALSITAFATIALP
ncbi:MAG: DUF3667 domain-containing protein [Chthoniobacterales bacterium]